MSIFARTVAATLLGFVCLPPSIAGAHVSLEVAQAPVGSTYKAVMRIPHGCAGAATTTMRIRVPEGLIAVKPMPKAGWTLETVSGDYKATHDYFGTPIGKGVTEIIWSGGRLLDAWYDEFSFRGYLSRSLKPETTLHVPVVQECEGGKVERWIEVPTAGRRAGDLRFPAPGLRLKAPAGHGGSGHH
jgi:periplasmic copper chaperone A